MASEKIQPAIERNGSGSEKAFECFQSHLLRPISFAINHSIKHLAVSGLSLFFRIYSSERKLEIHRIMDWCCYSHLDRNFLCASFSRCLVGMWIFMFFIFTWLAERKPLWKFQVEIFLLGISSCCYLLVVFNRWIF